MTNEINITKIKTGRGVAGAHIAVLFAPDNAPVGSLTSLVEFLNAQADVNALPGYEGVSQNHVLRISGLDNDEGLRKLLTQDYPQWCRQQGVKPALSLPEDTSFGAIDKAESFPHKSSIDKLVTEHANGLAGASYIVGNMGVLYSGWTNTAHLAAKHDWFKIYSGAAYNLSSVLLTVLGNNADNPRDAYSILEETYPAIKDADGKVKQQLYSNTDNVVNFIKKHPWEVTAGISFTGATSHLVSCLLRGSKLTPYETLASIGSMAGMLTTVIVPEKTGDGHVDVSDVFSGRNQTLLSTAELMTSSSDTARHTTGILDHISSAMGGDPLKVSATMGIISNLGYGISAFKQGDKVDKGLVAMSAGYVTGNIAQAKATKAKGASFDALVSAAADMIHADPAVAQMSNAELTGRVTDVVNVLSAQRDVVHSKKAMTAGIASRLERYEPTTKIDEPLLVGFLAEEAAILSDSPFLSSHSLKLAAQCEQNISPQRS